MRTTTPPKLTDNYWTNATVAIAERAPWQMAEVAGARLYCAGDGNEARRIASAIIAVGRDIDLASLGSILCDQAGHFALILETPDYVVAAVDACRTHPIYYTETTDHALISNDAYLARECASLATWNATAALEFSMAGFVTGPDTLVDGLHQLRAGELVFARPDAAPCRHRYFRFRPQPGDPHAAKDWHGQLMDRIDGAIERTVARAAGRTIFVPISGGFDSRLILCKLHQHGYRDLAAFSYGTPGNVDAQAGRDICAALDIPWHFVPSDGVRARRFFASQTRRDFWRFADGLSAIPNFQDLQALTDLQAARILPDDAVIINGQTGDFLSGGHILKTLPEGAMGMDALVDALTTKHFSLWKQLDTAANRVVISHRLRHQLGDERGDSLSWPEAAALAELWEFDERQAKYVINGQRIYEFLGLAWELPLWDFGLVRFFTTVPLDLRLRQRLYLDTLRSWDYRGLFATHQRPRASWPRRARILLPVEAAVRHLLGPAAHHKFQTYARYFGHYHHQYQEMSLPVFLKLAGDARNLLSLHCRIWLEESGVTPSPFARTQKT